MSNSLRVLLWTILTLGVIFIAVTAFWVFLLISGGVIAARFLYQKLLNKGTVTIRSYRMNYGSSKNAGQAEKNGREQTYTTVIDADDPDQEYQIPKFK